MRIGRKHAFRCLLAFIAAAVLLVPAVLPPASADAPFPSPDLLDGIRNINLTYTFATQSSNYGRHTKETLLHDVGYYDQSGKLKDTFFDAYLFLPCVTYGPSGGTMYESSNPAVASDWIAYLNDLFRGGYNVSALDAAAAEVGKGLGKPDYKVKVFFTILFPHDGFRSFGSLDGVKSLDFSVQKDRAAAVDWLMDEEIRRFEEGNYAHLELAGFYWFEEFLTYAFENELSLVRHFTGRVRDKGYKSIWIPYYQAIGFDQWKKFGFDVCCMQPNLMWQQTPDPQRMSRAISHCRTYGMSMEMELDNDVMTSKYNRFLAYLRGGVSSGVNLSINMYYQNSAPDVLYWAKRSTDPQARSVYDLTYRYAKGILTMDEIPADVPPFAVPKGYDWISYGKTYQASRPYAGDGTLVYQDNDGKELTDGIFGSAVFSTEFHAFHRSQQESGGGYRITVDLGRLESRIGAFVLEFGEETASAIGLPDPPVISVSTDGIDFRTVGTAKMNKSGGMSHAILTADPVRARYVRAEFSCKSYPFVFCSEFMIGQKKQTAGKQGDVNGDGRVNSMDYLLIKRYMLRSADLTKDEQANADVNGDGTVNAKDYIWVKRYVLRTK
ncbi:MAG: DUF4855 domain-containing protein [Clostridia bacterium]|nr:DUF4855 domain-containing protein [Clostridia bacterium]